VKPAVLRSKIGESSPGLLSRTWKPGPAGRASTQLQSSTPLLRLDFRHGATRNCRYSGDPRSDRAETSRELFLPSNPILDRDRDSLLRHTASLNESPHEGFFCIEDSPYWHGVWNYDEWCGWIVAEPARSSRTRPDREHQGPRVPRTGSSERPGECRPICGG
jgi:hypothetical protein